MDISDTPRPGPDASSHSSRHPFRVVRARDWGRICAGLPIDGPSTLDFHIQPSFSAAVGRLRGRNGRPELHQHSARIFVIRQGSGILRLGGALSDPEMVAPGEYLGSEATYSGYELVPLEAGTIVSIATGTPYQLLAADGDFSFLVARISA